MEHTKGKAHRLRFGKPGFAGLLPNKAGVIPPLRDPGLRAAALKFRADFSVDGTDAAGNPLPPPPGGYPDLLNGGLSYAEAAPRGPWEPPVRRVEVDNSTIAAVRAQLAAAGADAQPESSESDSDSDTDDDDDSDDQKAEEGELRARLLAQKSQERLSPPKPVVPKGGPLRRQRESLPVFAHRAALLKALNGHLPEFGGTAGADSSGACVIEGETGSGKVPRSSKAQILKRKWPT